MTRPGKATVVVLSALIVLGASARGTTVEPTREVAAGPSAGVDADERPNIVLVLTDDQTANDLRYMPRTRRLLGQAGATFTDFVSPHPLCCPARAGILTGQFGHNNGVRANRGPNGGWQALSHKRDTLGTWLQRAGYRTGLVGKFLNGYDRPHAAPAGWTSWNATAARTYNYTDFTLNRDGTLTRYLNWYQTDVLARISNNLVRRWAPQPRPFFLWVNHVAPHSTNQGAGWRPPPPAPRHRGEYIPTTGGPLADRAFNETVVADKPARVRVRPPMDSSKVAAMRTEARARAQSLLAVDESVASLVATLRRTGELSNTMILFTSDNGFLLGEHRSRGKNVPYEQSLRVPLLVRGPGVPQAVARRQQMSLLDLTATIVDLARAGRFASRTLDGRSMIPLLRDNAPIGYRSMLVQAGVNGTNSDGGWFWRGVRTKRYTYVSYPGTGEVELYDRVVDPAQLRSVHADPRYADVRRVLAEQLEQRRTCSGASCRSRLPAPPAPRDVGG